MGDIVSVIALLFALLSLIASGWLVLIERGRDRRASERERRADAALVQAFFANRVDDAGGRRWGIVLINAASSSVNNMTVWPRASVDATSTVRAGIRPTTSFVTVPPGRYFIELAEKGAGHPWKFPEELGATDRVHPIMNSDEWMVARFEFTDANGECWRRTYSVDEVITGTLESITAKDLGSARVKSQREREASAS